MSFPGKADPSAKVTEGLLSRATKDNSAVEDSRSLLPYPTPSLLLPPPPALPLPPVPSPAGVTATGF